MKRRGILLMMGLVMLMAAGCGHISVSFETARAKSDGLQGQGEGSDAVDPGAIATPTLAPDVEAEVSPTPGSGVEAQATPTPQMGAEVDATAEGTQAGDTPLAGEGGDEIAATITDGSGVLATQEQEGTAGTRACTADADGPEGLACAIQSALLSRDMATLEGLMADPFIIGYWGSEGRIASAAEIAAELGDYRLPADTRGLSFTTDRAAFPPLYGAPPEGMFGPELAVRLVVYSEGWGTDGNGAALLFIAQDAAGEFYWHGMGYSHAHFDK